MKPCTRAARSAAHTSIKLNRVVFPAFPSDPDKHLPAVEPVAEGPEDAEDEEA
jgi:hypothetical protein